MPLIKSDSQAAELQSEGKSLSRIDLSILCFGVFFVVLFNVAICAESLKVLIGMIALVVVSMVDFKNLYIVDSTSLTTKKSLSFYRHGVSANSVASGGGKRFDVYSRAFATAKSFIASKSVPVISSSSLKSVSAHVAMNIKLTRNGAVDCIATAHKAVFGESFSASCAQFFDRAVKHATLSGAANFALSLTMVASAKLLSALRADVWSCSHRRTIYAS